ncbi:MAG TPA: hypothetical protein VNN08_26295 [Thermoanaerobaculia bacterium]|nr:hypothetical protein [Thermoanaerobaculia bacterium]
MATRKIQATLLSFALLLPVGSAFAQTNHYRHYHTYRHHYSQTRGAVIGAVAGAAIDHRQPLKGALIGGVLGEGVQALRNHNAKRHYRRY